MKRSLKFICLLITAVLALTSCGDASGDEDNTASAGPTQSAGNQIPDLVGTPSDYSDADNWMCIPDIEYGVDTLYFYPTVVTDLDLTGPRIVPIGDEDMRAGARQVFDMQKRAFTGSTNVFAPFYRQSSMVALALVERGRVEEYQMQEQRTDVYAALDYYFEHYNEGRPFILAGHSQGSMMVKIVLMEYMQEHPEYYKNMVAAYVVGYSVTQADLDSRPYLKFAECADDTGVIVSWNTEGPGNKEKYSIVVQEGAISINPINWKRDDTYASADENLGTYVADQQSGGLVESSVKADAQVDTQRGVVICTATELPSMSALSPLTVAYFGPESYHIGDYFYYLDNIRENVKLRTERFLASHSE